jgi:hypothetical protein
MAENQESKIRKGQAFNLAVNDAVSNMKIILSIFINGLSINIL